MVTAVLKGCEGTRNRIVAADDVRQHHKGDEI